MTLKAIRISTLVILAMTLSVFVINHLRIVENVSMEPTIYPNDIVFIRNSKVKRNSIVIIKGIKKNDIIKRVIGVPGDYIAKLGDSLSVSIRPSAYSKM